MGPADLVTSEYEIHPYHHRPCCLHWEAVHPRVAFPGRPSPWAARGWESRETILSDYPYLEPGDIDEALRYAAFLADDETVELAV